MKEYKVVRCYSASEISKEVTGLLNDGWELHGAPMTTTTRSENVEEIHFYQAVVKTTDKAVLNG